jgi:GH15 family glucan-1,4-alpha-glucosidase
VFCRLLDAEKGGYLRLAPTGAYTVSRRYRGHTNVLETTFTFDGGQVRVTDLMPIYRRRSGHQGHDVGTAHRILRRIEALGGAADLALSFRPTFDYARAVTTVTGVGGQGALARAGDHYLALGCADVALEPDGRGGLSGHLRLPPGEPRWVTLTYAETPDAARAALAPADGERALARTLRYWERWAAECACAGPYRDQVLRSALTLKLLTFEPTGAVVAAPTTSLPEQIGGPRNWDYRFTWLRDSSLILYALMSVGHQEEAHDFIQWLKRTVQRDPSAALQIMYTIDGQRDLPELTLNALDGYCGSRPVRVGNAAAGQRQLDIYGEVLNAAAVHYLGDVERDPASGQASRPRRPPPRSTWTLLRRLVEQAAAHWQQPDNGIWEVRGGPQPFLYSRLLCWAALDSGVRLASAFALPAPLARWQRTRDAIRAAVLDQGFNTHLGAFTQAFGTTALDASALAIPRIGFLPATDPRVQSTVERIRTDLTRNGLVYRYRTADGLAGDEATFAMCTFWLVDSLALGGRLDDAHQLFEHTVGFANDVGLLAEEIDPATGALLGNFPQGFTHLALIRSAVNLAKATEHGPEHTAHTEAERLGPARRAVQRAPARPPAG